MQCRRIIAVVVIYISAHLKEKVYNLVVTSEASIANCWRSTGASGVDIEFIVEENFYHL